MDILNNEPIGRPSTPDPQCSICLNELTNKCYTNTCRHLFCYDCLQWWSNTCIQRCSSSEPTCPLCKQTFRYIYHSFNDLGTYETYTVPIQPSTSPENEEEFRQISHINRMIVQSIVNMDHQNRTRLRNLWSTSVDNNYRQLHNHPPNYAFRNPIFSINGQSVRIQVYVDNVWAVPLPNTDGRFIHGTTAFYRINPTQMQRLRTFIIRDIVAIRESVRLEGQPMPFPNTADFHAANLIMRLLTVCEISQLHLITNVLRILNVHAVHFCHELYNFALSIFEMSDYDNNVQYSHPPHDIELTGLIYQEQSALMHMGLDSNNEELQRPNIIDDRSSTNNSDVEVLSDSSSRSTDPLNSASINQPSTSTGIRDSLDRPKTNNRRRIIFSPTINDYSSFQSVNDGLSQVSYSSQVKRGRPNRESSSDDEESIIATQGSQTANIKSRDVNNKKKKKHQ